MYSRTMRKGSQKCGSTVSTIYEIFKEINIHIANNKNIFRNHLGNKGLHLNPTTKDFRYN